MHSGFLAMLNTPAPAQPHPAPTSPHLQTSHPNHFASIKPALVSKPTFAASLTTWSFEIKKPSSVMKQFAPVPRHM
jgi:hypothetical protein